jgi:CubicO group peptidase (beta-lactamase class C family)
VPPDVAQRVVPTVPADLAALGPALPSTFAAAMSDPGSPSGLMLLNCGGYMDPFEADSPAARSAVIGATGGFTNARGLSGLYRPLANGGAPLVDEFQLRQMGAVSSAGSVDAVLLVPSRFSLGFVKAVDNRRQPPADAGGVLWSEDAFGHIGFGGSAGFADPRAGLSFGYVMSRQSAGVGLDERGQSLIDATYAALGYRRHENGGIWQPAHRNS